MATAARDESVSSSDAPDRALRPTQEWIGAQLHLEALPAAYVLRCANRPACGGLIPSPVGLVAWTLAELLDAQRRQEAPVCPNCRGL